MLYVGEISSSTTGDEDVYDLYLLSLQVLNRSVEVRVSEWTRICEAAKDRKSNIYAEGSSLGHLGG
jgi:hypothetical protein